MDIDELRKLARIERGSEIECGKCHSARWVVSWSPAFGAWLCDDCRELATYALLGQ